MLRQGFDDRDIGQAREDQEFDRRDILSRTTPDRFCEHGTPVGSPCGRCAALGEMLGSASRFHVYISDGDVRSAIGSFSTREEAEAERETQQEKCNRFTDGNFGAYIRVEPIDHLFATASELKAAPVPLRDADLSRIRVLERDSPEGQAELRKRAERKAKRERTEGTADLAGVGAL